LLYVSLIVFIPSILSAGSRSNAVLDALDAAADVQNIPRPVLRSLCWAESSFNPAPPLKDDGGSFSHGLCQLKLRTARHMGFKGKSVLLRDPAINAQFAAKYLRYQLDRYNNDWVKAISAYNAGRYVSGNVNYVSKVVSKVFNEMH